jgi:hypothetical protein
MENDEALTKNIGVHENILMRAFGDDGNGRLITSPHGQGIVVV